MINRIIARNVKLAVVAIFLRGATTSVRLVAEVILTSEITEATVTPRRPRVPRTTTTWVVKFAVIVKSNAHLLKTMLLATISVRTTTAATTMVDTSVEVRPMRSARAIATCQTTKAIGMATYQDSMVANTSREEEVVHLKAIVVDAIRLDLATIPLLVVLKILTSSKMRTSMAVAMATSGDSNNSSLTTELLSQVQSREGGSCLSLVRSPSLGMCVAPSRHNYFAFDPKFEPR